VIGRKLVWFGGEKSQILTPKSQEGGNWGESGEVGGSEEGEKLSIGNGQLLIVNEERKSGEGEGTRMTGLPGPRETVLYDRDRLEGGNRFEGPAVVFQYDTTTVIPPGWMAAVDGWGNLIVTIQVVQP
jgi:N-methylhydantoinase A/oxoprolinase/acetone carboxylase beta subunit